MAYLKKKNKKIIIAFVVFAAIMLICFCLKNSSLFKKAGINSDSLPDDFVKVLDVGQGDSILLSSNGRTALIDTGSENMAKTLIKKLKPCTKKRLDVLLLTHNHEDHVGAAEKLSKKFGIENFILPDMVSTNEKIRIVSSTMNRVENSGGNVYVPNYGMYMNIGEIELTILCYYDDENDENDRSTVAMAKLGDKKFLLTGDAGNSTENRLMKEKIPLDCDVLKVGHHGSSSSTSKKFLEATTPQYAAISCGKNNQYSHPHTETLGRLKNEKIKVFRTDLNGDITFTVENNNITVQTEK